MKMSKKKTEVAVTLLILLAFIMLYVGVRISALAFLPACGLWILIGVVYWEKRRAENRYKKKGGTVMLMLTLLVLSTFSTPLVHATIYQGHDKSNPVIYPVHHLYVVVDTDADTINIIWEGCDVLILPVIALRCPLTPSWQAYDDNGFEAHRNAVDNGSLPHTGEDTIEGYTNTHTWLTVKITWVYSNGLVWITVPLKVKLYLGSSSGGGGGSIPCPTLFSWDGNDYVDYGVIDIHNPSGEDVVKEVSVQMEDVGLNNHKATFRLREGWEGLTFSESVIDQVKLYAIGNYGERYLCPLINAEHSTLGNVLPQLLLSDDVKAQMLLLETIDLTFIMPCRNVQSYTFVIEGCNMLKM